MAMVSQIVAVASGGAIGSTARFLLGGAVLRLSGYALFPYSTLAVNALGCFAIGLITGYIEKHHVFHGDMRLFLITGILGGFTTFSAFGFETVALLRQGNTAAAVFNVVASIALGLGAVWLGLKFHGAV